MTGKTTAVELEQIVETGNLDPDEIHLPNIYAHSLVLNANPEKRIERRTVRQVRKTKMAWTHDQMAARAARELQDGFYVNLGIGLPTRVANFADPAIDVWLQSENGMLGIGPYPTEDQV